MFIIKSRTTKMVCLQMVLSLLTYHLAKKSFTIVASKLGFVLEKNGSNKLSKGYLRERLSLIVRR